MRDDKWGEEEFPVKPEEKPSGFTEDFLFDTLEQGEDHDKKYFVLVIYDITDNKRRLRVAKVLKSFGLRVQKSAFEAMLRPSKYKKLLEALADLPEATDSIRVYKIRGEGAVTVFGTQFALEDTETIII